MILTNEDIIIKKEQEDQYEHFRYRLRERYGLEIAFIEYRDLYQKEIKIIKVEKYTDIGFIKFRNKKILIVYNRKKRIALTALPSEMAFKIKNDFN